MKKGPPGCLVFSFKGIILYRPIYVGILVINHYKDPVIKQSIFYGSRIRLVFFFVANPCYKEVICEKKRIGQVLPFVTFWVFFFVTSIWAIKRSLGSWGMNDFDTF